MSRPLEGTRFAATIIDSQTESDLISKIRGLGGEFFHKMDREVHFLIVGKRYTKKYDFALIHQIRLLSAETFFSVYVNWRSGEDLDFLAVLNQSQLKPFEGELICLSNMDARQKDGFHELITAGGGKYSIAFARVNSILVSPQPSGRKIDGAKKWNIPAVHPKWISDSMKFGAALNPARYNIEDPAAEMEPPEVFEKSSKNGVVADSDATTMELYSTSVLRRKREGDLLFNAPLSKRDKKSVGPFMSSFAGPPLISDETPTAAPISSPAIAKSGNILENIRFHFDGFDSRQEGLLKRAINSLGGIIDDEFYDYFITNSKLPTTRRKASAKAITEWAIERSIYLKRNSLDHIWSSPVFAQPVEGMEGLTVCISGFEGIEHRHATLLVNLVGATFVETLKADRDLLIATSETAHKVPYALSWQVPVVSIDWLWQSALAGKALPLASQYALDGRGSRPTPIPKQPTTKALLPEQSDKENSINMFENHLDDFSDDLNHAGNVRYHDDDAETRAQVLVALGEKPSSIPEAEPETRPAVSVRVAMTRRRYTE